MTDISKEAVDELLDKTKPGSPLVGGEWTLLRNTVSALQARVEELESALKPEMAELLFSMRAQECQLIIDPDYGWPCGLRVPMNTPPRSDEDWMVVANLDVEDSQFGPRLWDYAISVLKALEALKEQTND